MTVFVYVNPSKQAGDPEHIKVFATNAGKPGSRKTIRKTAWIPSSGISRHQPLRTTNRSSPPLDALTQGVSGPLLSPEIGTLLPTSD
jgi:hypothetical protein